MTLITAAILSGLLVYGATKSARKKRERQRQAQQQALPAPEIPALPEPVHGVWAQPMIGQSLTVATDCSLWDVVDPSRFALEIRFIYYGERLRGLADPYLLTNSILAYIAPTCQGPGQIRTMGELDLYALVYASVAELMFHEGLLTDEGWIATANDFDIWYTQEAQALSTAA